jgi:hypothetical protein
MIIKMPGRQVMPHSYCNDRRKYIHLTKHIVKNSPRGGRSLVNGCFNGFVNSDFHAIQEIDHRLMDIFYEIGHLSPKQKEEVIEIYLKTGYINWRILRD